MDGNDALPEWTCGITRDHNAPPRRGIYEQAGVKGTAGTLAGMFPSIYPTSPALWSVSFNEFEAGPIQSSELAGFRLVPHAPGPGSGSSSRWFLVRWPLDCRGVGSPYLITDVLSLVDLPTLLFLRRRILLRTGKRGSGERRGRWLRPALRHAGGRGRGEPLGS
jgi:hypothetical protein